MILSQSYPSAAWRLLSRVLHWEGPLESQIQAIFEPYQKFTIPKSTPGPGRSIEAPHETLKAVQRAILHQLLERVPMPPDIHGFVPGRSIVSHARLHLGQRQLLNYDLADAFPSVSKQRVRHALERRIGPLLKHRSPRMDRRLRALVLDLIADLCCHENRLPQGAPSSGMLLNLALMPLDRRVRMALRAWNHKAWKGIVYSRYADDLNLSAQDDLPPDADEVIRRAIRAEGLRFNGRKVHRADRALGQSLLVCGLRVEPESIALPRDSLRRFRAVFHKASQSPELSAAQRAELQGITGLLLMVYGEMPAPLMACSSLLAARHDLHWGFQTGARRSSGYSA